MAVGAKVRVGGHRIKLTIILTSWLKEEPGGESGPPQLDWREINGRVYTGA